MIDRTWQKAQPILWALMVLLIPITSLPLLARLTKAGSVASPSGLILLIFVLFWFIPYLARGGRLPLQIRPLLTFILISVLATLLSYWMPVPNYQDSLLISNQLKAFFTLAIGVCFYLVAAVWAQNQERISLTLRWLNFGGLILIVWAFAQAAAWYSFHGYPQWMRDLHDLYSLGPLYRQRVTGFALEPSWLAHQLNTLFLPLWLAMTVQKYSAHRWRFFGLSFENGLLAAGIIVLLLTLSRVGMLAFTMMLGYLLLRATLTTSHSLQDRLTRFLPGNGPFQKTHRLFAVLIPIFLILGYVLVLAAGAVVLSRVDPRMAKLFDFHPGSDNPLLRYANDLNFAARIVYWQAGWSIYQHFPGLGVGLGNAGFYIPSHLPPFSWGLFEVRDLVFRSTTLLNIKSIWVRILAETGIVGFSVFVSWLVVLWFSARMIEISSASVLRVTGLAGKLIIIGYLLEGFSVDTFAFPYPWLFFGLVTAAAFLISRTGTSLVVRRSL